MTARFALALFLVGVAVPNASCDREETKSPETSQPAAETDDPSPDPSPVVEKSTDSPEAPDPEPEAPAQADYEDAAGAVQRVSNIWMIVTAEEGSRRICLPANTPADVLEEGAKVRFTLYLGEVKPNERRACHPVRTLVSIRRVD